ncbi:MAG: ISL3 family transposase [Candidatus Thiodiazotropha sp. (ex Lucinoma borealis)]|nr:ISL3 family transposase [Candidatus Thiodiazotropha sp. (ex Lucinoma borealis)]
MLIKTILNQVQKFKCFVYTNARLIDSGKVPELEIEIKERTNSQAVCTGCNRKRSGYDRLPRRRYEFIPMWGIKVFFCYAPRRVDCPDCGVVVEQLPWTKGKRQLTETYAWFLAGWAKRLSWQEVAQAFRTSWDHVFNSVEMAVNWGKAHRDLSGVTAIGVDEIQWHRGHQYLTLVYQIDEDNKRLLWIGEKRSVRTLLKYFRWFGKERTAELQYICSDMWKPYLKVIRKKAANALHILDRFHIMAHINKAIDEVRAQETRSLKEKGLEPVLTKSRWLLLKKPENLSDRQESKLADLLQYNLKSIRSYLLKEDFQRFWDYVSPYWAGQFLDQWTTKTMRSKIEPMKKIARMLRRHKSLLMNWFKAKGQFSSGIVEGFNNKVKLTVRKSYGFRTYYATEIALFHALGALPVPETTHEFF